MFNAAPANGAPFDPTGPCPQLKRDEEVALAVNAKQATDEAKVAELVASGVRPVRTIYADGGQNAEFAGRHDYDHWQDVSRPEALQQAGVDVPVTKVKVPSLAKLEAEKRKAEIAAALAEKKAEAAHAFAYAEQPVARRRRSRSRSQAFRFRHSFRHRDPTTAPTIRPATAAAEADGLQHGGPRPFLCAADAAGRAPPAPDTTGTSQQSQQANAPAPQPASTSAQNPQLATSTLHEPVPSKFSTSRMAAKPTPAPQPESQAEANADAAKAAYAQGMNQTGDDNKPLVPNPLQSGFSAFAGGDH